MEQAKDERSCSLRWPARNRFNAIALVVSLVFSALMFYASQLEEAATLALGLGAESLEGIVCTLVVSGAEFELMEPKEMIPGLQAIVDRIQRGIESEPAKKTRTKVS